MPITAPEQVLEAASYVAAETVSALLMTVVQSANPQIDRVVPTNAEFNARQSASDPMG